ncbi:DUF2500 domain-containing protein [Clostridium sp. DL1XJH146]
MPLSSIVLIAFSIGIMIFMSVRLIRQWNINNNSPKVRIEAVVDQKRYGNNYHNAANSITTKTYYISFRSEAGEILEFIVPEAVNTIVHEGDAGTLEYQGTRFLGFNG